MKKLRAITENTLSKVHRILEINESYQAPAAMMKLLFSENRKEKFLQFLEAFDYDLSHEWFYQYFEDEHADRKNKKQDFTPESVSRLISDVLNINAVHPEDGYQIIEEPAVGCGSTIIQHWNMSRMNILPWDFRPDDYLYLLTEKATKTIPFLLFNLMIRGMNAIVIHGDSLTMEREAVYWIYNEENAAMTFSDIYRAPVDIDLATINLGRGRYPRIAHKVIP